MSATESRMKSAVRAAPAMNHVADMGTPGRARSWLMSQVVLAITATSLVNPNRNVTSLIVGEADAIKFESGGGN